MKKIKHLPKAFIILLFIISVPKIVFCSECRLLIPGGESIGVSLYMKGILVTGLTDVASADGASESPAEEAGVKIGDIIEKIDGTEISSVEALKEFLKESKVKKLSMTVNRDGRHISLTVMPTASSAENKLCIGVWVKDAACGIGTLTFTDPETGAFAALGHGISDAELGNTLPIESGRISKASINEITKGQKGIPGELKGSFSEKENILGSVSANSPLGLFGTVNASTADKTPIPTAEKSEVHRGKAFIYTELDSKQPESYEIEIMKISNSDKSSNKGMVIKITDKRLLDKTGGIVRGMSGSPIIQDGKLVGAVTHVFINDPTRGYGIFVENMLSEIEELM